MKTIDITTHVTVLSYDEALRIHAPPDPKGSRGHL